MPINFPAGAANGDTYTYNNKTWVYSSTTTSWSVQYTPVTLPDLLMLMGA